MSKTISKMTPEQFKHKFSDKIEEASNKKELDAVMQQMYNGLESIVKDETGYSSPNDFNNNKENRGKDIQPWIISRARVWQDFGYHELKKQESEKIVQINNADPNYVFTPSYHGGKMRKVVKKSISRRHRRLSGKMRRIKRRSSRR